ncbi:DUF4139 domain-containing protein [Candidatus Sumerlaeota bacterium]|nr:DUF4139 domain-containing protein [Candidatus Sumerlaeota bacterium]
MRRIPHTLVTAMALLAAAAPLSAKMDLTTLPMKDASELTIYNSQDLTLGRETRALSFRKGLNQIQFSWANTQIDPTSLQLDLKGTPGLTLQDAVYPKGTDEVILWSIVAEEAISSPVEISYFVRGLSWSSNYVLMANKDETAFDVQQFTRVTNNSGEDFEKAHVRVVVGDVNLIEQLDQIIARWKSRFPAMQGLPVAFRDMMSEGGALKDGRTELREQDKKMTTESFFRSDQSADLAAAKEIFKKAVSEYRLFSVEGEEDLKNGWSKALPNPKLTEIPFDLSYELDSRRYGPAILKFYKLQNDEKHKLGKEVFPEGNHYVYRVDERGGNAFEAVTWNKYVPEGEKIELNLGSDGLVTLEDRELSRQRSAFAFGTDGNRVGWDETVERRLDVKNSRSRAVPFKLTYYPAADGHRVTANDDSQFIPPQGNRVADVIASEPKHEQVDRETIRWELPLPAQSTTTIKLTYVLHYGTNAKAN